MISLTGILSLLSALAATSYALSCTQCMSTRSSSCSGISVTCPPGYRCGSSYAESTIGGEKAPVSFFRTCIASYDCNFNGSLSIGLGKVKRVTSCCNTNHCTPTIPPFPTQSSDPNGVVCRSCVSADSTWCYTSDTIQCTGDETTCLLLTTKIRGSVSVSSAIRGCGTKSLCDLGRHLPDISGLSIKSEFICTSGGISVHTVVLTPPIACLLLTKWFF